MKIAHVIDSLDVGGAEQMVIGLARAQQSVGHQVLIICLFRDGVLAVPARAAGIEVVNCGKRTGMDFGAVLRLRGFLGKYLPKVLHTHNPVSHYYAVLAAVGLRLEYVINTWHNMGPLGTHGRREALFRLAMPFTDRYVAVCEAARKRLVQDGLIGESKTATIPNGIESSLSIQRNVAARERLLRSLSAKGEPFVFGSVGRLNSVKDQVTMLRAFSLFLNQLESRADRAPLAVLLLAGEGDQRSILEREREQLSLDGFVYLLGQRGDIPLLLAGFDAFVLSSRSEGYSLALVEAAAAGLPIVATDVGGNAEIVQNQVTGLLVPPGSPKAMAAAMLRLFENEDERLEMGAAGRLWALENGSIESMYERYMELYQGNGEKTGKFAAGGSRG